MPREVRLDAAHGQVAPRGLEQLALLMHLVDDDDAEVQAAAAQTLEALPPAAVSAALARSEATGEMQRYFAARGIAPSAAAEADAPLVDVDDGSAWEALEAEASRRPPRSPSSRSPSSCSRCRSCSASGRR